MTESEFFEALYRGAEGDRRRLGWNKPGPAPILTAWLGEETRIAGKAVVVACGVGNDAEHLASLGWDVSAFDISPTAIDWARRRSREITVDYRVADLFALPAEWQRAFDLVLEVWTIQSIPPDRATDAISAIADLVGDGGTLLVSALTSSTDTGGGPPWPVDPVVLDAFTEAGLTVVARDEADTPYPSVRAVNVEYRRI